MGDVTDSQDWVDFKEVKEKASAELVLRGLKLFDSLTRKGDELVGKCPFHPERSRDDGFSVNVVKKTFHCFTCKKKGNMLELMMYMERCTLREAAWNILGLLERERFENKKADDNARWKAEFAEEDRKRAAEAVAAENGERKDKTQVEEELGIPFYLNPDIFLTFAEANRLVVTGQARSRDFVAVRVSTLTGGLLRERNRNDD